jgi:hypothetical protein
MWQSLLRVIDPGTFAEDTEWSSRFLGLTVTVIGIFLAGSLIGLIASLVDQQVTNLRKGRSTVIESGHTLILGWSERVPVIVRELVLANESRRRTAVVVLADHDKTEMEDRLREEITDDRSTRIVCRSGNTNLPADLRPRLVAAGRLAVGDREVTRVVGTYGDAPPGTLVALVGSQGVIEAAVVQGRADTSLAARTGTRVILP